jgi:hypothetical protein
MSWLRPTCAPITIVRRLKFSLRSRRLSCSTSLATSAARTLLTFSSGVTISQFRRLVILYRITTFGTFLPQRVRIGFQCQQHAISAPAQKRSPKPRHATKPRSWPANIPPAACPASNALQVASVASPASKKAVTFYGEVDVRTRLGRTPRARITAMVSNSSNSSSKLEE